MGGKSVCLYRFVFFCIRFMRMLFIVGIGGLENIAPNQITVHDFDGSHFKGLLINFLHEFWPSLLKLPGFLFEFITPILKASKDKEVVSFFTMAEYEKWKEVMGHRASEYDIKYYQGLGANTSQEGKEYFASIENHKKAFVWNDDKDDDAIDMAFCKTKSKKRKNWIKTHQEDNHLDSNKDIIQYCDFINKELLLFCRAAVQRSIPSMVDGLKEVQRKILFSAFKKAIFKEVKVAQFAGYVAEHSSYRHAEENVVSCIIRMAQNHLNSNNINLLYPGGQFGTHEMDGNDFAGGRYIYTRLCPITRRIFPESDDLNLNYPLDEHGQTKEPTWYMPIIPMILVNGCYAITTGWKTFIPKYNPVDIIGNIRRMLKGKKLKSMHPWYRKFKGKINKDSEGSYTSSGKFKENKDEPNKIIITELPLTRSTQEYKAFLEKHELQGSEKQPNEC